MADTPRVVHVDVRDEAKALRDAGWSRSARPEIKQLMDSLLSTVGFLDVVAQAPTRQDLVPALDAIEFYTKQLRRTN